MSEGIVGTSGWSYAHWDGVLYPAGTPPPGRLAVYASRFTTAELNSSFYRWPSDAAFASWRRRLPEGFRLAVKAPRGLTHARQLYGPDSWLERIVRGMDALGERRGPLLVQLPPTLERDESRLSYFLERVPSWLALAVEMRNPTWHCESVFALLERHGAAYCVMSGAWLPCVLRATAPFVYVRLHGPDPNGLYGGSYSEEYLRWWTARIQEWRGSCRDVFAYFNNDGQGHAVRNALHLKEMLVSVD